MTSANEQFLVCVVFAVGLEVKLGSTSKRISDDIIFLLLSEMNGIKICANWTFGHHMKYEIWFS